MIGRQLGSQARWYRNALDGITDEESKKRTDGVNTINWLAAHLLVIRYGLCKRLGYTGPEFPYVDLYADITKPPPNARTFDNSVEYPSLETILHYWDSVAEHLEGALQQLPDEALYSEAPRTPLGGNTLMDALGFMVIHESYHLGQISLLRRALGHPPMRYF